MIRVGEAVSLETTPLDPVDRAEFDAFVSQVEPMVRRSLVARHGPGAGRTGALDALGWAWLHWDLAADVRSPVARLIRIGTALVRRAAVGFIADGRSADRSQEELTRALAVAFDPAVAEALASLSADDRAALLMMSGDGVSIRQVAHALRRSTSSARRCRERGLARLRSTVVGAVGGDVETMLANGVAQLDVMAPKIMPAEVIEHADRVGQRIAAFDDIEIEQSRPRVIVGVLVTLALLAVVVWWAGGPRDDVTASPAATSTASTTPGDAGAFAPTGIAAQSELTVYPILPDPPEGYRLIDRSLTLDPSQTFGQVITGLVRNDPEPWRRRLWLFDPGGTVVASIVTFDFAGSGELDFARTIEIDGVPIEYGQDPSNGGRWWAMVLGVSAGSSSSGAVFIGGVVDEATVLRIVTEVAGLDPRDPQFAVSLAANMGPGWQTYREPRTVDIAAARYVREDGGASIFVSSFAAPPQSDFSIVYPAAEPSIAIRQVDGPMFVSVAMVPSDAIDPRAVASLAESVQLVRRDEWNGHAIETAPSAPDPAGDLLPTGLTSTEGGSVTVGIPAGQLCIRVGKSPNPIRASGSTCTNLRPSPSMSTAAVVMIGAHRDERPPERFVAGAASTTASHIRSTVIGSDGASTITESPFVRDRSLGPALWAVRIPPGGRLQSVEYLDDAGRVLDHIGPTSA